MNKIRANKFCKVCGKEYTPNSNHSKYCSKKCRDSVEKIQYIESVKNNPERNIEELKKTFRLAEGKIEKIDRRCKRKEQITVWREVTNKINTSKGVGYCRVSFGYRDIAYHVLLWMLYYDKNIPEGFELDHINGDRVDNRIENLRLVTHRKNQQNRIEHREGKIVGASWRKDLQKYHSTIRIKGKDVHLGYFNTEIEAHRAYKIACKYTDQYVDSEQFRHIIRQEMNQ